MQDKGLFITVEGIDGSGKSTFATALVSALREAGVRVAHTREPGGTCEAERIRKVLLDNDNEFHVDAMMMMMFAARIQHIKDKILPEVINRSRVVVCERFNDTSYAYQVSGQNASKDLFNSLEENTLSYTPPPDLTFYLDVSPQVCALRLAHSGKDYDVFENKYAEDVNFGMKLVKGYEERIAQTPHRFIRTPEMSSLNEVKRQCVIWADALVCCAFKQTAKSSRKDLRSGVLDYYVKQMNEIEARRTPWYKKILKGSK